MKTLSNGIFGLILGILVYKYLLQDILDKKYHHGPNSNDIKKYVYKKDDKYYQFITQICPCPV